MLDLATLQQAIDNVSTNMSATSLHFEISSGGELLLT